MSSNIGIYFIVEDRLGRDPRERDDAASEDMTPTGYEEILSDEEEMGDIGSLDSLLEEGVNSMD